MKNLLTVFALLAGLGSFISCKPNPAANGTHTQAIAIAQPYIPPAKVGDLSTKLNPFNRYLDDTKRNWHEPMLIHFAGECHVDLDGSAPHYAQRPGEIWEFVHDLSHALEDQETDFYGTVAVWHADKRILVDRWGMELDTGDYFQMFLCLEEKQIVKVDFIRWKLKMDNDDLQNSGWGFEHRWKLGVNGIFETESTQFIDLHEKPIAEPAMEPDTRKGLREESVVVHAWSDLELPPSLL